MLKNLKLVLLTLACAALISIAISGTLASLNQGATLIIKQMEQERIVQSQSNSSADNLTDFVDGHRLTPSNVSAPQYGTIPQQWEDGSADMLFADTMTGVVDKIVSVKNEGTENAYVRTWFAFEQGSLTKGELEDILMLNLNSDDWQWQSVADGVIIEGERYLLMTATREDALISGEVSAPSLMQFALTNDTSAELIGRLDGNADGVYNILVASQAWSDPNVVYAPSLDNYPWQNGIVRATDEPMP